MLKQEVKISFDTGTLTEIIEANKLISHYAKHHPHAGALERLHWNRAHAEKKLAALQRVIRFMDRYDLISCPVTRLWPFSRPGRAPSVRAESGAGMGGNAR